jgi:hypothetical protein
MRGRYAGGPRRSTKLVRSAPFPTTAVETNFIDRFDLDDQGKTDNGCNELRSEAYGV